ncbi:MAG: MauE/DoxX family redox-associated membrane protein [Candidatus Acidiferrales bacterium]
MTWRVLHWLCRLALGALFIYAGFTKLYPPDHQFLFEMAVSAYQLLPVWGVIVVARALPWFEIALGLVLILGWKLRYSSVLTALIVGGFITAMAVTYARGIEADCGCFGFGEPISPFTLARDSLLLVMAIYLAGYAWRARSAPAAAA